ncbi:hypothetical protein [Pseudonocardia spinosispora]|uniref:hypothetical protein n=1 Tax=Pseudonocardia spinosispora TaxID=103441 RepID=UPI00041CE1B3|nr:hypothetical protein [Pseudonocardia spinosispora]
MLVPTRLLALGALTIGLTACGAPAAPPTPPAPPAAPANPLAGVDWATATTFTCPLPEQKVEVVGTEYGDVTGDGVPDAVVSLTCSTTTSSNPIQVEAFDGVSDRAHPRSLGVLIEAADPMYVEKAEITIARSEVTVVGHAVGENEALAAGPQVRFTQTFTFRDGTLHAGPRR